MENNNPELTTLPVLPPLKDMAKYIYDNAVTNNDGDHLKAAKGLVETLKLYPDARHNDSMEALDALLREALLRR